MVPGKGKGCFLSHPRLVLLASYLGFHVNGDGVERVFPDSKDVCRIKTLLAFVQGRQGW